MEHGAQKLYGLLGGINGAGGRAPFPSLFGFSGPIEPGGGLLVLVSRFTRMAAAMMAAEMLVACLRQHLPHGPGPILSRGELALRSGLIWCFLATHGAGALSLDGRPRRLRRGSVRASGGARP